LRTLAHVGLSFCELIAGTHLAPLVFMALLVDEIMNRELFSFKVTEYAADALAYLLRLGISGGPVLNSDGKCVGMLTLRDLVEIHGETVVGEIMTRPVITIPEKQTIADAAKLMAEAEVHSLPVVDSSGGVVGIVSSLDLVRGLTGLPARHPQVFLRYDRLTGQQWSDDRELSFRRVESAPTRAGVVALVRGGTEEPERLVWVESADNLRARLIEILSNPDEQSASLRRWLRSGKLRFRAAVQPEATQRDKTVAILNARIVSD
jgi:CBS-domain-containing membrane protein